MSRERQKKNQEEIKERILDIAEKIIKQDGIKVLSIRKITSSMDYSPGIVYHYFKNKNEILENLFERGYMRIIAAIMNVQHNNEEPEKEIKEAFISYIKEALSFPEEYLLFMLNDDKKVVEKVGILSKDVSKRSKAFNILCNNIERGIKINRYSQCDVELTAQILWTATFGLLTRLIIEKDISADQINKLIERHFEILFNGILKR